MQRKNIIITGASSGIGEELAKQFAQMGRNLVLCARRTERLQALASELEQQYPAITVLVFALDVNQDEQVFTVFKQAKQQLGSIDRVIVNAGIGKGASIGTGYYAQNKLTAVTNFVAALCQCEAAMEIFREQNSGHLVTISSVSSQRGFRRSMTVYAATKAGLASLTEGIRIDTLGSPIKVSTIHPGYIKTEITDTDKNPPFLVDVTSGCNKVIAAIEAEKNIAFVPGWPWAVMRYILPILPLSIMRRLS
ncbi:SDR family oxidoreductase [Thalassotalea sp. HSM 43]|uniref:SDR family oxidoreductase n=1 Tax=Thalassotalea sp. HSM 43 TaxID=2552945 RepID=UPI0010821F9D|nr:SDR family oxidoreductase [Thalassotalea sp. HSM 43]QBY03796.1 SDR family oxidoreductase [Thalassotalea sp. HSM 43]